MSASHLPNLNTLRRGGTRLRGRTGYDTGQTVQSKDDIVRKTDDDAATSRLSAVDTGYLDDPFAPLLTPGAVQRRLPLMNRGTYLRTKGIDRVVDTFLKSQPGRKQIISLGAGSDTRYFRMKAQHIGLDIVYHEIDFEANVKAKLERLSNSSEAIKILSGVELSFTHGQLAEGDYRLHARDLRSLKSGSPTLQGIQDVPTLIISECCLIYLSPEDADAVMAYFAQIVSSATAIVIYEPIRPSDAFGHTMVKNLTSRGIYLQTLEKYADLGHQRQRLSGYKFNAKAADIDYIWREWISAEEKERIDALEWLDEVEEFVLLAKHYCIAWGWKGFKNDQLWEQLLQP